MNRTLWKYLPAATEEERAALSRLAAAPPEERTVDSGGKPVRVRISVVVESACDGKVAVGVTLSLPGGPPGEGLEKALDPWALCARFLEEHLAGPPRPTIGP